MGRELYCNSFLFNVWAFLFLHVPAILTVVDFDFIEGWIWNILLTRWVITLYWDPWQHKKLRSCSRGSTWRAHVWFAMVGSWWSLWLGYLPSRCWIHIRPSNSFPFLIHFWLWLLSILSRAVPFSVFTFCQLQSIFLHLVVMAHVSGYIWAISPHK